jgi:hypothetical protein
MDIRKITLIGFATVILAGSLQGLKAEDSIITTEHELVVTERESISLLDAPSFSDSTTNLPPQFEPVYSEKTMCLQAKRYFELIRLAVKGVFLFNATCCYDLQINLVHT